MGSFNRFLFHHIEQIYHHYLIRFMLEPHTYHNFPWSSSLSLPGLVPINPSLGLLRHHFLEIIQEYRHYTSPAFKSYKDTVASTSNKTHQCALATEEGHFNRHRRKPCKPTGNIQPIGWSRVGRDTTTICGKTDIIMQFLKRGLIPVDRSLVLHDTQHTHTHTQTQTHTHTF